MIDGKQKTTVQIGKRTYAVGLLWDSASSSSDAHRKAQQAAAATTDGEKSDLFCVRRSTSIQFGLGEKNSGHKSGQYSLAAHLADAIDDTTWLGAFKVDGGYYIMAVREDSILAEMDQIFVDEEMAQETFGDMLYRAAWKTIIAPADWNFEEAEEYDLQEVLDRCKPRAKLGDIDRSKARLRLFALIGIIVAAAYFGPDYYRQYMESQEKTDVSDQFESDKSTEKVRVARPYENEMQGIPVLLQCMEAISGMPLSYPGWDPIEITCDGRRVQMSLTQNSARGTSSWLEYTVERRGISNASVSANGENATLRLPLNSDIPKVGQKTPDELLATASVQRGLSKHLEELFIPVQYSAGDSTEITTGRVFEITSPVKPDFVVKFLANVPALTIDEVKLEVDSGGDQGEMTWKVRGQFYEDRIPANKNIR